MIATWPTRVGHSVSSNPSTVIGDDPAATNRVPFIFASSKFKKYKKHIAVRHRYDNVDHIPSSRSSASIRIKQNVRETKANSIKQQQCPLAYYTSYTNSSSVEHTHPYSHTHICIVFMYINIYYNRT